MTFPHTMLAAYLTGGAFVAGVALWLLVRGRPPRTTGRCTAGPCASAPWVLVVAGIGVAGRGDMQGKIMTEQQPMKMAAAEALYETKQPASFSVVHDRIVGRQ